MHKAVMSQCNTERNIYSTCAMQYQYQIALLLGKQFSKKLCTCLTHNITSSSAGAVLLNKPNYFWS